LLGQDAASGDIEWDFPGTQWSPDGLFILLVGMSDRNESHLWEGVTYEAVAKLMNRR
jgi:hypothetical protein